MPNQDIGSLGPKEGSPVSFHWRWYCHIPTMPLWALIALLLIVPKANRDRRALLILIPLVVVLLVWRMPLRLLAVSDGTTEGFGFFITTVTMAWSMVWLLGFGWGGYRRIVNFLLAFVFMFAVGLLSYCSYFSYGGLVKLDINLNYIIPYAISAFILLAAMMLSSHLCRKKYSPHRFFIWLAVWNYLVTLGSLMVLYVFMFLLLVPFSLPLLATFLISTILLSAFAAILLYLVNLPFIILALKSPFYGDRLASMFHIAVGNTVKHRKIPNMSLTDPPEIASQD